MLQELLGLYGDNVRFRGTSHLGLAPGDLVSFNYEGQQREGLVVRSKRTSNGMFISTQNNLLLNIFLMDNISFPMIGLIVNTLYNDRLRCSYQESPRILGAFFTKNSFRTFNVSKARNFIKVNINR